MTLIVAFGHQSGVGKNTAAAIVRQQINLLYPTVRVAEVAFFDEPKDFAAKAFSVYGLKPRSYYETVVGRRERHEKLPAINKTPTEIWIETGRALCSIHENVLVDSAFIRLAPYEVGLITDVRKCIEAVSVQRAAGVLVHVTNSRAAPLDTMEDHYLDDWQAWDWHINNSGTMDELRAECARLTYHIMERLTSC